LFINSFPVVQRAPDGHLLLIFFQMIANSPAPRDNIGAKINASNFDRAEGGDEIGKGYISPAVSFIAQEL